jgi:PAS domain S-box-containing protein
MNRAGLDMIQASSLDQVQGGCVYPMVADEHREPFKALVRDVFQGKSGTLEFRMTGLKGRSCWLYTQTVPLRNDRGEIISALSVTIDITERKKAEEALSRSEERYRSLFEDSPISLWEEDFSDLQEHFNALRSSGITDFRAYFAEHPEDVYKCVGLIRIISLNKATLGLYEAPDQASLLQDLSSVFTDQSFESFRGIIIALAEGTRTYECEAVNRTLTGRKINVLLRWSLLPGTADQGSRALVSIVDITDRKEAEEKLRASEEFIRSILDTVDEGFIVIDRDFRILTANKAYCSQVGESCDTVIGRRCHEISHKSLRPCYEEGEECAVRQVFETGEPHSALHRHPDAKGSILYVETKAFPIKDRTGAVISVIETVNNITERHLLKEEQLKTQKLEAIGTLAGGIAHDFNNLLQGVFGYISMAKMVLDQKERSLSMLEQAEKALHMSVDLTTQLLTFSKGGKPVKKKITIQPVIENSAKFALSGSSVDYRIKFDEDLWTVEADEGQIGQVIQNIVLNADQAMPAGGTIAISAKNVSAPGKGLPAHLAEGNYVEISVEDNGIGVPEQYIPRLFDPYFTTKEKGSGLGLATSYSIIKNHGGLIDVKSQSGRGSTFFVYLPALETEGETVKNVPASAEASRKGRVLVMDDEELVRNIVGIMLRALGHEVKFAEDGEEAIAKYREALSSGRRFDIVILDLTIRGGMGGEEALKELLALDPEVKAVVSSGYSDSATISEYEARGFSACLAKPYEVDALKDVLNALLK